MRTIDKAVYKIRRAINLFLEDGIPDRKYRYKDIEPQGTVERAWKDTGDYLRDAMQGTRKDK